MSVVEEEWRRTTRVIGYEVSNLGRVRHATKLTIKGTPTNKAGYPVANLWCRNVGTVCYVHDLVAEAFLGPKGSSHVNHRDGDKLNNTPANLEYVSNAENARHAHLNGLSRCKGEENGKAKLTQDQVLQIRRRAAEGERTSDLAREFGVKPPIISQIKSRSRWAHV